MKEVANRLEALRVAQGFANQADMAQAINAEVGTYNHWATGRRLISVSAAIRVCAVTGATLDYIYRGDVSGLPLRLTTLLSPGETAVKAARSA